jgi:hypothetical protein
MAALVATSFVGCGSSDSGGHGASNDGAGRGGTAGTGPARGGSAGDAAGRGGAMTSGAGRGGTSSSGAGRGGTSSNDAGRGGTSSNGAGCGGTSSGTAGNDAGAPGAGGAPETGSLDCARDGDGKTTLVFVNGCASRVTYAGNDVDDGELAPGEVHCVDVGTATDALSAKRYWGYAGSDPGAGHYSLAEFTFNTDFHDFDWYDISFVDAFNLPMAITPLVRPDCDALACPADFLAGCPDVGQFEQGGKVVACVSPERDNGDSAVAQYFEQCDDAYAWSADDQHGTDPSPTHACAGEDFAVTFCPPEAP